MKASIKAILLSAPLMCLICGACDGPRNSPSRSSDVNGDGSDRLQVVCTTTMIEDLARNLAADLADVRGIMKAGEDPHVYDVRPRDAELIADADLVLSNGFHLEATLSAIITNNAQGDVLALAENAVRKPISSGASAAAPDPHCWMNVDYFRGYAEHARDALIAADPGNADAYRANADKYLADLDKLNDWVKQQVDRVPRERRVMVTSHDAFAYFGQAYDVDVHGMIGISTEQAPRPQDIEQLEALIRDRGVRAMFIETSVSSTLNQLVEKSAEATGVKIGGTLYSDSLDAPDEPAGSYIGMMQHNVSTIVKALQ
jgi:manganese/zinc/iron transport system substrate-binding protein